MKILVAGLGLIGASLARRISLFYEVHGIDIDKEAVNFALKNNIIKSEAQCTDIYDFVIVALPPQQTIDFINASRFKDKAVVTDICGVKESILQSLNLNRNFYYIGTHPMAGKEKGGILNSSAELFDNASLIITLRDSTHLPSVKLTEQVYKTAGFKRIIKCDEKQHDRIIAYTSQLAHVVSSAYVKSPSFAHYDGFTGGSFQDMTRIAGMNENIWTVLFMMNRKNLKTEIDTLILNLKNYSDALDSADSEKVRALIKEGRQIKEV